MSALKYQKVFLEQFEIQDRRRVSPRESDP